MCFAFSLSHKINRNGGGGAGGAGSGWSTGGSGWNNYDSYAEHGAHSQPVAQQIAYNAHGHKVVRR